MGESACLMHPFAYASSGTSVEAKQENPIHAALGESISFGRFVTESLSWDKRSTFSHKRYVEEAERYAQKGAVAQKKAFFEAHYKSIAAKKAAALLEQANASNNNPTPENEQLDSIVNGNGYNSNAEVKEQIGEVKVADLQIEGEEKNLLEGLKSIMETPSPLSNKKPEFSSPNSAVHLSALKVPSDESTTPAARKTESSRVSPSPCKASADGVLKHPSATPCSENKRSSTPLDTSAPGSKTTGPRWHILSALNKLQSPSSSVPSRLKAEERAARRKQKLEEKFNAKDGQKVQLQTSLKEKGATGLGKWRQSLCFKAQTT